MEESKKEVFYRHFNQKHLKSLIKNVKSSQVTKDALESMGMELHRITDNNVAEFLMPLGLGAVNRYSFLGVAVEMSNNPSNRMIQIMRLYPTREVDPVSGDNIDNIDKQTLFFGTCKNIRDFCDLLHNTVVDKLILK